MSDYEIQQLRPMVTAPVEWLAFFFHMPYVASD